MSDENQKYVEAEQYLYVEAREFSGNDRKKPTVPYVNGDKAPDDPDKVRSEENPYLLTYEETETEKPYLIVAARDGHFLDIDVDIGDGHEDTWDGEIEDINIPDGALGFRSASGGLHIITKFLRDHKGVSGVEGVDIQGDTSSGLGLVTSPFHHPDYEVAQEPDELTHFDIVLEHEGADFNKGFEADLLASQQPDPSQLYSGDGVPAATEVDIDGEGSTGWFTVETAKDALGHISFDVGYNEWRNIGFALADEFPDEVALELFKAWYQHDENPRYDPQSDSNAEDIIFNSDRRRRERITVGTLIHHASENGWECSWGGRYYDIEACSPPGVERHEFENEQRWDELQGERYQEWLDANRPTMIWGDDAGSGKTTNAALAAAQRERPHTVLFDKHEKAREFIDDDATPDGYFHLKGGEQPVNNCCMKASVRALEEETPDCPVHGHPADWPRMNPIYEREAEDDLRQRYEALVGGVGPRKALIILDDDGELIEDNPWIEQFDGLENRDRIVGVHEYQTLKTAVGDRDLILDETPRLLSDGQRITVDKLTRAHLRLDQLADIHRVDDEHSENLRTLGQFAADVRDTIADGEQSLADLDAPDLDWETYFEVKDPMSGHGVNRDLKAETLAQVKLEYNEGLVTRIREGDWNGEPFCMDALLAAAAEAGVDDEAAREAIAVPSTLDACPWCGATDLGNDNGARFCTAEGCGWHEAENTITQRDGDAARALAWLDTDTAMSEQAALVSKILPPANDFPEPLDLDATATPSKVAGMYGEEHVEVTGDEPLDLTGKMRITQVLDGQYHAQTIKDTDSIQDKIQSVIDTAGEVHRKPLFGIRSDLVPLFEFPENGEVLKYHGARGLNRSDCDAVVCIGAPHPDVEDVERDARLLAMDRDDLRVGGDEHSTRRNAPNPPVYRKLLYEGTDGEGAAVPTKHYTGLVGDLFRESREKEIEQFVHRVRPLLADGAEVKDAYLLTNVPTDLPIDEIVNFDELTGDLSAVFPVSEGAIRLLGHARDMIEDNSVDGFRATALVEENDDGTVTNKVKGWHRLAKLSGESVSQRTVRNWVSELESVGLLTPEKYEQHAGVGYAADLATSKRALQVLSYNAGFEVAAVRRLGAKLRESAQTLGWLEWAEAVFGIGGDRCLWDPPRDGGGGSPGGTT